MKPREARARRRSRDIAAEARGRAFEEFLAGDGDRAKVVPELIPDAAALTIAARDVRRLMRLADRTPKGPRRSKLLDELLVALARLVFVERVMALDPLERAALTPARLVVLSSVGPQDLRAQLQRFRGESGLEVAR